ncbi:MAG TPA: OmpA family protein [Chitinophagaceae bacterium]|nr:OmpA family protein [Chitinophagaceae bacterium]
MKRPTFVLFILFLPFCPLFSQVRVAFTAGAHQSDVDEMNNLSNFDSLRTGYSGRTGVHFGLVADLPFRPGSKLSFRPGVSFYNKGRRFAKTYDTSAGPVVQLKTDEYINYIDFPMHFMLRLGKKFRFIAGGGPSFSFFFNGKIRTQTFYFDGSVEESTNEDPPVGNGAGQYSVLGAGIDALAGFESGRVFLLALYSRGLGNFFEPANYTASDYKHRLLGATLGVYLGRPGEAGGSRDRDGDGIADTEDECPTRAGPTISRGCPDRDADGIADLQDKCPDVPGNMVSSGCPVADIDSDGVYDNEDRCPSEAGPKKYNGCPVPDTDKDGVNDEEDMCPTRAGYGRYAGCPIPDGDGDGVDDESDHCPYHKGTQEQKGCPVVTEKVIEEVNMAARQIHFEKGAAELLSESRKVLDELAKLLSEYPQIKLQIEGHTSNDGTLDANMKLSQKRAETVKNYLHSRGISEHRLNARGYGPTQPLSRGASEAEKARNRRVELKLSN